MSKYRLWLEDEAKSEIRALPGNVRQRIKRAIEALAEDPRPHNSHILEAPEGITLELRRIRLDKWRILYCPRAQTAFFEVCLFSDVV